MLGNLRFYLRVQWNAWRGRLESCAECGDVKEPLRTNGAYDGSMWTEWGCRACEERKAGAPAPHPRTWTQPGLPQHEGVEIRPWLNLDWERQQVAPASQDYIAEALSRLNGEACRREAKMACERRQTAELMAVRASLLN